MSAQFAELGLPFSEAHGGSGCGSVQSMIVAEAFGRRLVVGPGFAAVVLGGGLLGRAAGPAARRRVASAKVQIGRSGRKLGQEAVQSHGGIGVTTEYAVGHAFKRMSMIELMFGDADTHLARLAESDTDAPLGTTD